MVEGLEIRKSELRASLQGKYENTPKKWWQNDFPQHISTKALAATCKKFDNNAAAVIIRTKIVYGIFIILFFLTGLLLQILPLSTSINMNTNPVFIAVFAAGLIFYTARVINRKPLIIVDINGLWTNKISDTVLWENVAGTFIKRDGSEGDYYYLLVHYFDPPTDRFQEFEYRIDELDIKTEELAFYIEKFKGSN